jgi:DeoR/GlpR family transcriptional regulator of sugar metabolism
MARVAQSEIDDRRRAMTALLRERSYLPVGELCRRFGISEATARRDLVALTEQKTVVRTFGGAMADYDRRFAPFADRLAVSPRAKARIASAAVSLLSAGMTVFLDAGTTVSAVAERLRRRPVALRVVTNSLAVGERLAGVRGVDVDLLGGRLLPSQSVLLGDKACRAVRAYTFDLALLGAEGFDGDGLSNSTGDVVALQRAVVDRAARHAVLADATKAGVRAAAPLLSWDELDLLITDAADVPMHAKTKIV